MNEIDFRRDLLPMKNKLFRLALRITAHTAEAEDVVEDVLVKTWELRHSAELQSVQSLEAYCLTMTRNLALDRAARKDAQHLSLDALSDAAGSSPDGGAPGLSFTPPLQIADTAQLPDAVLEVDESLQWVHRLFDQLPEKQRTVMQLRDIDEHSYQEIAEILSISESDVKVTLFRARQTLRQLVLQSAASKGLKLS